MTINTNDHYEKGTLRLLKYIYNQMERSRNHDFSKLGITSSQASVMLYLFKNRDQQLTQQNVQSTLMLSHPTITGLMQRLELKDFIKRTSSQHDGRCKFVTLTNKGEEIEKSLKRNTREMEKKALEGLTQDDLAILDRCLNTIAENIKVEEKSTRSKKF